MDFMNDERVERLQDLLDSVSEPQLIAAVGSILAHRRRQALGLLKDAEVEVDVDVAAFLATASNHQLSLLKEIALGMNVCREQ